jgi:hypothetical protein
MALPHYPFTRAMIEYAPETNGVYGLLDAEKIIYIGKASEGMSIKTRTCGAPSFRISSTTRANCSAFVGWIVRSFTRVSGRYSATIRWTVLVPTPTVRAMEMMPFPLRLRARTRSSIAAATLRPAEALAFASGALQPCPDALLNHGALKLGENAHHPKQRLAPRRSRIDALLMQVEVNIVQKRHEMAQAAP